MSKFFNAYFDHEEALKIRKSIHGQQHEAVATVLQELGDLMDDLGEYESAMSFYIDALEIRRNRLGPDDIAVAETLYRYVCGLRRYSFRQEDTNELGNIFNNCYFLTLILP